MKRERPVISRNTWRSQMTSSITPVDEYNQTMTFLPSTAVGRGRNSTSPDSPLVTIRGMSLDRRDPNSQRYETLKADYLALQESYKQLQDEHSSLVNDTTGSTSTVIIPKDYEAEQLRSSFANEAEDLNQLLSDAHNSIQDLLSQLDDAADKQSDALRQLNHIRYTNELHNSTKEFKINLVIFNQLKETIQKKAEELKTLKKDLQKTQQTYHESCINRQQLEEQCRIKDEQILQLESKCGDKDLLKIADLYQQLTMTNQMLEHSQKKVSRYETFIQQHLRDKKQCDNQQLICLCCAEYSPPFTSEIASQSHN